MLPCSMSTLIACHAAEQDPVQVQDQDQDSSCTQVQDLVQNVPDGCKRQKSLKPESDWYPSHAGMSTRRDNCHEDKLARFETAHLSAWPGR